MLNHNLSNIILAGAINKFPAQIEDVALKKPTARRFRGGPNAPHDRVQVPKLDLFMPLIAYHRLDIIKVEN